MPEKLKYSQIKELCAQLKPRQILQVMLSYTVQAAYSEVRLKQEIDSIERVLFPPAMVAQGSHYVPLERHYVNEKWAQARIKLVRDDGSGRVTSIDNGIYQCLTLAEELQRSYQEYKEPSQDKIMLCAYECFNRILPVLGLNIEDLVDAVRDLLE